MQPKKGSFGCSRCAASAACSAASRSPVKSRLFSHPGSNLYLSIYYFKSKLFSSCCASLFSYFITSLLFSLQICEFQKSKLKTISFHYYFKTVFKFILNPRFDTQLSLTYNTLPVVRDLLIVFIIFQNNSDILKVVVGDVVSTNLSSLDFYDDLVSTIAFSMLCGYLLEMVYYVIEAVYTIFF